MEANQLKHKTFTNPSTKTNLEMCKSWIVEQELTKSRLVSISMSEDDADEGDN